MATKIDKTFDKAIASLKELNEKLFYNDLRDNFNETTERLGKNYRTTAENIKTMESKANRLVNDIEKTFEKINREYRDVLESGKKELAEDANQIIENFFHIQKEFILFQQELKEQKENQEKVFIDLIEKQLNAFKESIDLLEEQFRVQMEKQENSFEEQLQHIKQTFEHVIEQLTKEFQLHIVSMTEMHQTHNKFLVEKFDAYQQEVLNSLKGISAQNEFITNRISGLESKLQEIEVSQKNQFEQLAVELTQREVSNKKTHQYFYGIGAGILTLQVLLIVLQFI